MDTPSLPTRISSPFSILGFLESVPFVFHEPGKHIYAYIYIYMLGSLFSSCGLVVKEGLVDLSPLFGHTSLSEFLTLSIYWGLSC